MVCESESRASTLSNECDSPSICSMRPWYSDFILPLISPRTRFSTSPLYSSSFLSKAPLYFSSRPALSAWTVSVYISVLTRACMASISSSRSPSLISCRRPGPSCSRSRLRSASMIPGRSWSLIRVRSSSRRRSRTLSVSSRTCALICSVNSSSRRTFMGPISFSAICVRIVSFSSCIIFSYSPCRSFWAISSRRAWRARTRMACASFFRSSERISSFSSALTLFLIMSASFSDTSFFNSCMRSARAFSSISGVRSICRASLPRDFCIASSSSLTRPSGESVTSGVFLIRFFLLFRLPDTIRPVMKTAMITTVPASFGTIFFNAPACADVFLKGSAVILFRAPRADTFINPVSAPADVSFISGAWGARVFSA